MNFKCKITTKCSLRETVKVITNALHDHPNGMQWFDVPIQYDASYEEAPVQILDRKMKSLRHREIPLVKVLWQHHGVEEATWELETTMQERYPHLFAL